MSSSILLLMHLFGLAFGVGAGTVKLILLFKSNADYTFLPVYFKVSKPITRTIVFGVILLTLSGIIWLWQGYGFTTLLIVKIILVAGIWILGILIDNAFEPKLAQLTPAAGESPSPEFRRAQKQHLMLEFTADAFFYIIIIIWVFR